MKIKEARRYIGEYYANVPRTIKKSLMKTLKEKLNTKRLTASMQHTN
jgi:hypothetical protein|nr:MAG TPA: hypothetical protein [Caudoviricetes sp.]